MNGQSNYTVGVVATRLNGTDGVSLEMNKWREVLERLGNKCVAFTGMTNWEPERSHVVPEAFFGHEEIARINNKLFARDERDDDMSDAIHHVKRHLKQEIRRFHDDFGVDIILAENALSLPMNIPLGLALTEFLLETEVPCIAHHHDFWWERERYLGSRAGDYIAAAFPPELMQAKHVAINSVARRQVAFRKGIGVEMIPNVMDFAHPPPAPGDYANTLREDLGIPPNGLLVLQPTRVVPRKRIERTLELVRRLDRQAVVVITHDAGDEGTAYRHYLERHAELMGVDVRFAADRFHSERGENAKGEKVYSLADAYHCADFVSYPSDIEGFGNAFLEAIYYKRPIVMHCYEIFSIDIMPKGFETVVMGEFLQEETVEEIQNLIDDPERVREMCERNYEIASHYYSFEVLEDMLGRLLREISFSNGRNCHDSLPGDDPAVPPRAPQYSGGE